MNKNKFFLGTILGAAAGVVAGMLTAPQSGKETRDDLKAKAAELKEEAAKRANNLRDDNRDAAMTLKEKADRALHGKRKSSDSDHTEDS